MKIGLSPQEWRAMTPRDWMLKIEAWNEVNAGDSVKAPTREEFDELVAKYG